MPTPPSFISVAPSNSLTAQSSTTAGSVTLPTTAAWDILILVAVNGGATAALTTGGTYTGSWTSVGASASTAAWGGTWWSRCTGDHAGQTVTAATATNSTALGVIVVRGCRTGSSPIRSTPAVAQHAVSGVPLPADISVEADDLIVYTLMADDNVGWSSLSCNHGSMAERMEVGSSGGADSLVGAATLVAGFTGLAGTWSGTHTPVLGKVGIAFALAPDDFRLRPPMMAPMR